LNNNAIAVTGLKISVPLSKKNQKNFFLLYKLAEIGCCIKRVEISTKFLAESIPVSQQTVSRHLIELEKVGWIERNIKHEGTLIKISDSGITVLGKVFEGLKNILQPNTFPSLILEGTVFSGLGEGAYYITRDLYRKQFRKHLGFDPYPGTLNLKLSKEDALKAKVDLENYPAIAIEGFKNKDRTYGTVKCYHVLINNKERGAALSALRTHYDSSVLEIISPVHLRSSLNLEDNDKVKIEIFTSYPKPAET